MIWESGRRGPWCGDKLQPLTQGRRTYTQVWNREIGYWVGNYTFLGNTGAPFTTPSWPYPYQPYSGIIHINITGNHLQQRNIFIYPPLDPIQCALLAATNATSVKGNGACGVNGNEKIFQADQFASDCAGNLGGPYPYNGLILDTNTTVMGNDTVIYQVSQEHAATARPTSTLS